MIQANTLARLVTIATLTWIYAPLEVDSRNLLRGLNAHIAAILILQNS
jgi:hypothetical protein